MLKITKAEEQAVRLVMRLATAGRQLNLATLADREDLPEPTVAKLLGMLRRGGVVLAERGRNGGYQLADTPERISTAQIVWAVSSEPIHGVACTAPDAVPDCPRQQDCGLRSVWRHLEDQVVRVLENTSIADLLEVEDSVTRHVRRVWPVDRPHASAGVPGDVVSRGQRSGES